MTATPDLSDWLITSEINRLEDEIEELRRRQCLPALAHLIAGKLQRIEHLRAALGGAA